MAWDPKTQLVNDNQYTANDFVKSNHILFMLPIKQDLNAFKIVNNFSDATDLLPIGKVQNLTMNQTKQMQRFFELGSNVSDFAENGVDGTLGISKLLVNTGNLLKYFNFVKDNQDYYFNYPVQKRRVVFSILHEIFEDPVSLLIAMYKKDTSFDTNISGDTATGAENIGGYNSIEYPDRIIELKNCVLNAYSLSVSANTVMIAENLQFVFSRIEPVTFDQEAAR